MPLLRNEPENQAIGLLAVADTDRSARQFATTQLPFEKLRVLRALRADRVWKRTSGVMTRCIIRSAAGRKAWQLMNLCAMASGPYLVSVLAVCSLLVVGL